MSDYATPQYSVVQVNAAGRRLASFSGSIDELADAIMTIDNWRASHSYPLQSFYVTLKRRALSVHKSALTAQRNKRLESIAAKLIREKKMKLSQMQDIGGCRAILPSIAHVRELEKIYVNSRWHHEWIKPKDYIKSPKVTGYRGVHLKYKFSGKGDKEIFNGLKIEIQLRTKLQHIWATAVEAADVFTKQALKSNHGSDDWKRFFALISSVFAIKENEPLVPNTPNDIAEIANELRSLDAKYHILSTFIGYRSIMPQVTNNTDAVYYLVMLDPIKMQVEVKGYKKGESKQANIEYTEVDKDFKSATSKKAVLVSVASINALKRAYPNYFLDTDDFVREAKKIMY